MNQPLKQSTTIGSASLIGLSALVGALIGFGLQLLVAFNFGASALTDAFFMASSTSELLGKLLMGGSITAVFLPLFVDRLTRKKKEQAWYLALNVVHIFSIPFVLLLILLSLWTEPFVHFIAPGFDQATTQLTVNLLRVLLPSFLLLFVVDLAVAMLHSLQEFKVPALLRLVAPSTSIISIIILGQILGIYSLALGVVIGSAVQLLIVGAALYRHGFSYRLVFSPFGKDIQQLVKLVYPFIFSVLVTQSASIIYRILVSDLSVGSLSALKYAEKITQLLTIIFLNSVTIVIYPLLSRQASQQDYDQMKDTLASAIRLTTFVTLPLIIGISILREPLIVFIYEHGSFTSQATQLTMNALLFLVIGLTTTAISSILGHAVLALQHTRAAVAITIASQGIAIILFVLLVPRMAHAGLALASSLVPISSALLYFLYLQKIIPKLSLIFWHPTYLKIISLSALLTITLLWLRWLLQSSEPANALVNLIQLLVPSIAGTVLFFGGAYWWGIPEMNEVKLLLTAKYTKWFR